MVGRLFSDRGICSVPMLMAVASLVMVQCFLLWSSTSTANNSVHAFGLLLKKKSPTAPLTGIRRRNHHYYSQSHPTTKQNNSILIRTHQEENNDVRGSVVRLKLYAEDGNDGPSSRRIPRNSRNHGGAVESVPSLQPCTSRWSRRNSVRTTATARRTTTCLCLWNRDNDGDGEEEDITDDQVVRWKSCFPYLLPLMDGDHFGHYIYERIPIPLGILDDILLRPLVEINDHVPLFGLSFFVALTLGTRFNWDMDRNVRYNAQLAALIDIALIFPELIASGFQPSPWDSPSSAAAAAVADPILPRSITEPCANFVWYAYISAVVYCISSNLRGKKPTGIPWLSQTAEWMVGPF